MSAQPQRFVSFSCPACRWSVDPVAISSESAWDSVEPCGGCGEKATVRIWTVYPPPPPGVEPNRMIYLRVTLLQRAIAFVRRWLGRA